MSNVLARPASQLPQFTDGSRQWTRAVRVLGKSYALDGLRGLAWCLVFLGHVQPFRLFDPADTGMFIFFALSGFLITQLAVDEFARKGSIDMRAFVRRRVVRLVPALVVFVGLWLVVAASFIGSPWLTTVPQGGPSRVMSLPAAFEGVGVALAYVMNWFEIEKLFSTYVPLGHIWSLAVEMQFYILWISLLLLILRFGRRAALWVAIIGSAMASFEALVLMHYGAHWLRVYMGTDTRGGALLGGAAAALFWSDSRICLKGSRLFSLAALLAGISMIWSIYSLAGPESAVSQEIAWPITALAASVMTMYLVDRPASWLSRLMSRRTIRYLGKRSYALYLWHYVWLTWFRDLGFEGVVAALVMSLLSAELSWRLVEKPASRWRAPALQRAT